MAKRSFSKIPMKHKPVKSSAIESVGYDPKNRRLEIKWKSGSLSIHNDVPQHVVDNFLKASSIGAYWHSHIKGTYPDVNAGGK